jgi:hypothetical protein
VDLQRDVVNGDNVAESLGDTPKLQLRGVTA